MTRKCESCSDVMTPEQVYEKLNEARDIIQEAYDHSRELRSGQGPRLINETVANLSHMRGLLNIRVEK